MDNMPQRNTREAAIILRSAWDVHDIGQHVLHKFKRMAKVTYSLQVVLGVVIAAITIISFMSLESESATSEGCNDTLSPNKLAESIGLDNKRANTTIFALSIASSFLAAIVAYYQPAKRWRQLRGETQFIASEIWRFRTRTGRYTCVANDARRPERELLKVVKMVRTRTVDSADLGTTSWEKKYPARVYRHSQWPPKAALKAFEEGLRKKQAASLERMAEMVVRRGSSQKRPPVQIKKSRSVLTEISNKIVPFPMTRDEAKDEAKEIQSPLVGSLGKNKNGRSHRGPGLDNSGAVPEDYVYSGCEDSRKHFLRDNHASPLKPPQYVELRIETLLDFYRSRVPTYSNILTAATFVIIIGTVSCTTLAYTGYGVYVGIITAFLAGTTSLMEFHATDKKLQRYNATITSLQDTLLWWKSMTDVERASRKNADQLVDMVENAVQSERSSWMATMQINIDEQSKQQEKRSKGNAQYLGAAPGQDLETGS
jgi:hypothetical protein